MRPPLLLLLLLPLLPLQCVLGTMASAAASSILIPEEDEWAAKKIFVQLGAHESSPWTWHVAIDKITPTRRDDGGRVFWRVRIRWWQHAKWPHNGDRVVRSGAAQTKEFQFETEEQALASMYSTVMAWAVERWGDQLTDQQQRDRRGAAREQQRTTRQQAAQGAVQRLANEKRQQLRPNVKQHLLTRHIAGQAGRPSGGARRVVSSPQRELTTRARTSSLRALM